VAIAASSFAFAPSPMIAAIVTGVGGLVLAALFYLLAKFLAKKQVHRLGCAFGVYQTEATRALRLYEAYGRKTFERAKADLHRRHANDRKRTDDHFLPLLAQIKTTKETEYEQVESEHDDKTAQIATDGKTAKRAAGAKHDAALAEINS